MARPALSRSIAMFCSAGNKLGYGLRLYTTPKCLLEKSQTLCTPLSGPSTSGGKGGLCGARSSKRGAQPGARSPKLIGIYSLSSRAIIMKSRWKQSKFDSKNKIQSRHKDEESQIMICPILSNTRPINSAIFKTSARRRSADGIRARWTMSASVAKASKTSATRTFRLLCDLCTGCVLRLRAGPTRMFGWTMQSEDMQDFRTGIVHLPIKNAFSRRKMNFRS